jgi:hypothetical protein
MRRHSHARARALRCARALRALLSASIAAFALSPSLATEPSGVEVRFRGCEAAGWCRFVADLDDPGRQSVYLVVPDGVVHPIRDDTLSRVLRDRLNALLSIMIHQHKRIELHGLRLRDDGTYAAKITVNGADVASDPALVELIDSFR